MADITFVNGMKPNRKEDAPDWAVLKQTIDREKFIPWLQEQPENTIYIETLIAKSSGNLYTKVDDETREYKERVRKEGIDKAKAALSQDQSELKEIPSAQFNNPTKVHEDGVQHVGSVLETSTATEQFDDDIPF